MKTTNDDLVLCWFLRPTLIQHSLMEVSQPLSPTFHHKLAPGSLQGRRQAGSTEQAPPRPTRARPCPSHTASQGNRPHAAGWWSAACALGALGAWLGTPTSKLSPNWPACLCLSVLKARKVLTRVRKWKVTSRPATAAPSCLAWMHSFHFCFCFCFLVRANAAGRTSFSFRELDRKIK